VKIKREKRPRIPFTTAARLSDTFSDVTSFYITAADEENLDLTCTDTGRISMLVTALADHLDVDIPQLPIH